MGAPGFVGRGLTPPTPREHRRSAEHDQPTRPMGSDVFEPKEGGEYPVYDAKTLSSLEEAPRSRPVVASQTLRCIRGVDNLTELDGSHPLSKGYHDEYGMGGLYEEGSECGSAGGSSLHLASSTSGSWDDVGSVASATEGAEGAACAGGVPVYVMLPLDCVTSGGMLKCANERWFKSALMSLRASGVQGVMVDVWWGSVERKPRVYDWTPYQCLIKAVKAAGLRMQMVFSFHACGSNVGDTCSIPLPKWVLAAGEENPDMFFTDRARGGEATGQRNRECISLWADHEPVLEGRTPLECYRDFMASFRHACGPELGRTVTEVCVGTGPCGELRYPSYPMHTEDPGRAWRFPGVGEFQCYDRYARAHLAAAAGAVGHEAWGRA
eukprot:CAMPEP_0182886340 /NCGR_PEP_ID=MMETSP0034_2-20130328/20160_1 /TAXON_ID=156128 /ORGANISM="Nephroselmis pyriformis, Strain CCMP717" /LENGTH=380 /DNA_ID=CAMNT_0025019659 /DNA_START=1 /DNA_END=1139 /DNA_ORIENTATION=-